MLRAMNSATRTRTLVLVLVPFAALLALALALFAVTSWIEGTSGIWRQGIHVWLARLDASSALETLSNAAEVVAAVLAIAITVVAIVVELAANRYTHRITQLFVREPVNVVVMGFFVLTTIQCLWVSAAVDDVHGEAALLPFGGVAISMAMVTLCLLILLPYFAYVFAFLHPLNVVSRIRSHAFAVIRRGARRHRPGQRAEVVSGIEELEDVALNAMEHRDRGISMASVDALGQLVHEYQPLRQAFPDDWFRIDGSLARDPDFVSMAPVVLEEILEQRIWFEMKVLRQFHTLFVESVNRMRDVSYLIALDTRRIAAAALRDHLELFDLAIRFFNSYLRAAINAKDPRTAYYVLHQYRQLAEEALEVRDAERVVTVAEHLRFYGQLAYAGNLPFLLEAVAYELALLTEEAITRDHPESDALLDLFLQVDKESESPTQETSLRGVRRAQVQFATFLLLRGDVARAKRVYEDMERERPERLASIRDELLAEQRSQYWEVTDRGVNFAYLPPDRRAKLPEFFAWFGARVPPPKTP
jgi:hypothetical protein